MNEKQFELGLQYLRAHGLDLVAVFDCADLPDPINSTIRQNGIDLTSYQRLVLVGNSGQRLWWALERALGHISVDGSAHPIDEFSRLKVKETVRKYFDDRSMAILYPGEVTVPLQKLGALAGWHHDSPLGIGIHSAHGLWFAYRAAFLIDAPLPLLVQSKTASPCERCPTHDCVTACPAGAVRISETIDTDACIDFALTPGSPCRTACLAREACPVSPQSRYNREQIAYHYERAIKEIEKHRRV